MKSLQIQWEHLMQPSSISSCQQINYFLHCNIPIQTPSNKSMKLKKSRQVIFNFTILLCQYKMPIKNNIFHCWWFHKNLIRNKASCQFGWTGLRRSGQLKTKAQVASLGSHLRHTPIPWVYYPGATSHLTNKSRPISILNIKLSPL